MYPSLYLTKKADRRLRSGHLWIYSNEVDSARSPLKNFQPGDLVNILATNEKPLGTAYVNPNALICGRLLSRAVNCPIDAEFFAQRLRTALALRERCFAKPFYRLVYGDSDGLPGLVVERFGDLLVVQLNTAGMARRQEMLVEVLHSVLQPQAIVLRNDSSARTVEGLPLEVQLVMGSLPETLLIEENDTQFCLDVLHGQKTGWFFDHRMNRLRLQSYSAGKRVLDVFSYTGAWGIQAARAGASAVLCLDSSATALAQVQQNAQLNQVAERVSVLQADAFEGLKQLQQAGEQFDILVLDPPAFIKRRKDYEAGLQAYHRLTQLAVPLLKPDSLLVSASCSLHLPRSELLNTLLPAARSRQVQILEQGGQGADHPVHPAIPETDYLKALFCRIL